MNASVNSTQFRKDVESVFQNAADIMGINPKLTHKIKVANAPYITRFGVRLRGQIP